jgi:hypothetical protein
VLWQQILFDAPPPLASLNPGVDPTLAAVAERCLVKEPAARFQSAAEILDVLGHA